MMKYLIKPEDKSIDAEAEKVAVKVAVKYQIHFRYRKPHAELLYKKAFINRKPAFYLDCLNNENFHEISQNPVDLLVKGKISKVLTRVESKARGEEDGLVVMVPTGDLKDMNAVIIVTLVGTVGAAMYLAKKTMEKTRKKDEKKGE